MDELNNNKYDCSRGCSVERDNTGMLNVGYEPSCCKLSDYNWLQGIQDNKYQDLYEVRFKNTRKMVYRNDTGQNLRQGDLVVVEAVTGHDLGIVTLEGAVVLRQLARHKINPETAQFRKIYRKAKPLDVERWQEAIAREHSTMIRARQLADRLGLQMKIGDVEFQGDGSKAIFYYIADERVDFRQLIKDFAEEFHIRIEMKQIGARQEAGLIGGIGVCGRPLCCSQFMADFKSITTQAARCQDLSLNPQKLAGQCSKLKCCINYEASVYIDSHRNLPDVREPLEFKDGLAYLVKTDVLAGTMWFSYDKGNMANMFPLTAAQVREIKEMNRRGSKGDQVLENAAKGDSEPEFVTAVGDDSISRFDEARKSNRRRKQRGERHGGERRAEEGSSEGGKAEDRRPDEHRREDRRPEKHQEGRNDRQQEGKGENRPERHGEERPERRRDNRDHHRHHGGENRTKEQPAHKPQNESN